MLIKMKTWIALVVWIMALGIQAEVFFEDDFSSGTIDRAKWDVKKNDKLGSITFVNGTALFTGKTANKAVGLITNNTYDFSTTPLVFQATMNTSAGGKTRSGFVIREDKNSADALAGSCDDNQVKIDFFSSNGRLVIQTITAGVKTQRYDESRLFRGNVGGDVVYQIQIDATNMVVTVGGTEVYSGVHELTFASAAYFQLLNFSTGVTAVDDVSIISLP